MKTSSPAAADDKDGPCFSRFSCLPDDVSLEIFKKLIDLKTLCVCKHVCKQFYAIVHQVDTICYTSRFPCIQFSTKCKPFYSALKKFNRVKSVCIRCPSSITVNNNNNNGVLFKWKVKMGFNRINSFVFVSPTSIYDKTNNGLMLLYGEEKEKGGNVYLPLFEILKDVLFWVFTVWRMAIYFPLLEKVSITDSDNRGRVSVNGRENIDELRNWTKVACLDRLRECYVPLLELPVSGYVMKGVTLVLMDWNDVPADVTFDSFINDEIDFKQDKEEAAYHEAMREIFKKHRASIVRML